MKKHSKQHFPRTKRIGYNPALGQAQSIYMRGIDDGNVYYMTMTMKELYTNLGPLTNDELTQRYRCVITE